MTKRKTLSKKTRFEVFKRDSFKCQYCGKSAPDVILQIDHVTPVSKGGEDDILNLITSCADCNQGKSDVELSDDSALQRQRQQLEELNERREQLKMLIQWREGLKDLDILTVDTVCDAWADHVGQNYYLNDRGIQSAKRWIRQFGMNVVLDAMETAATQYFDLDDDGVPTKESVELAFKKVPGICRVSSGPDHMCEIYYARGILRNRLHYCNQTEALRMLKRAYQEFGVETSELIEIARDVRNWTEFCSVMDSIFDGE